MYLSRDIRQDNIPPKKKKMQNLNPLFFIFLPVRLCRYHGMGSTLSRIKKQSHQLNLWLWVNFEVELCKCKTKTLYPTLARVLGGFYFCVAAYDEALSSLEMEPFQHPCGSEGYVPQFWSSKRFPVPSNFEVRWSHRSHEPYSEPMGWRGPRRQAFRAPVLRQAAQSLSPLQPRPSGQVPFFFLSFTC